jgi:putative ABC transport system permease protein
MVSLAGGFIGVVMGIGLAFGASATFKFPFVISYWAMGAGVLLAMVVGLVAGVIPALNASRLDPIIALRSE